MSKLEIIVKLNDWLRECSKSIRYICMILLIIVDTYTAINNYEFLVIQIAGIFSVELKPDKES